MLFRHLRRMPDKSVLPFVRTAMDQLRKDYEIILERKVFEAWPGEPVSFDDFIYMLLVEKDVQLKLKERGLA